MENKPELEILNHRIINGKGGLETKEGYTKESVDKLIKYYEDSLTRIIKNAVIHLWSETYILAEIELLRNEMKKR
jgi:Mg/Co/Ni transporter MgtE